MVLFKMAWRNVWRYRRRSMVTIAAITLALFIMVLYTGLVEGYIVGMEHNVLDLEVGEIQIFAQGFIDSPSLYTRISNYDEILTKLEGLGYQACARLLGGGLAAAGQASAGVSFRGIDPEQDAQVSQIHKHVAQGQWLSKAHPKKVVLGRRLFRTLGVGLGDEIIALSQAADGSVANDLFIVGGVLKGISDATDRSGVFMTSEAFREFFCLPAGVHQIIIGRSDHHDLNTSAERIRSLSQGLEVKTWRELMPTLASMFDSMEGIMIMVFFIVYIAIGILILNAMLMAVFERIRELGLLKALGVGPAYLLGLVFTETAIITGLALLVGLTLCVPGFWYLINVGINMGTISGMSIMGIAVDPVWRAVVNVSTIVLPVITLVLIVLAATLYPALKAAVIQPVRAMHHQ